jgi:predicted alpha/beta hydrolase
MKGGVEFNPETVVLENIPVYCELCAWALAHAHAKSGDAAMISGYIGKGEEFAEAMTRFAFAYADQTEKDYRALVAAAKSGRINVAQTPAASS